MDWQASQSSHNALTEAQATIAHQTKKIAELQQDLEREQFAQELRQLISDVATINTVLSPMPYAHLLQTVMQTSAQIIGARAGSIFLIDKETRELILEIAFGLETPAVKKFSVPLGHGIVGLVAVSGQPMAIANAQVDERLTVDIASPLHHIPESLLCVPLFYEDEIIGVLELLDKIGDTSFCPTDVHILGLFANMAAVAIAQSQAYHDQQAVLKTLLHAFTEKDPECRQRLYSQAISFSTWMESGQAAHGKVHELALLVDELATSGEHEYETCKHILQGMVTSLRNRSETYDLGLLSGATRRSF
jgi:signal transduction protein with GAF and PtsI domain